MGLCVCMCVCGWVCMCVCVGGGGGRMHKMAGRLLHLPARLLGRPYDGGQHPQDRLMARQASMAACPPAQPPPTIRTFFLPEGPLVEGATSEPPVAARTAWRRRRRSKGLELGSQPADCAATACI
jgi:hypothetical protein